MALLRCLTALDGTFIEGLECPRLTKAIAEILDPKLAPLRAKLPLRLWNLRVFPTAPRPSSNTDQQPTSQPRPQIPVPDATPSLPTEPTLQEVPQFVPGAAPTQADVRNLPFHKGGKGTNSVGARRTRTWRIYNSAGQVIGEGSHGKHHYIAQERAEQQALAHLQSQYDAATAAAVKNFEARKAEIQRQNDEAMAKYNVDKERYQNEACLVALSFQHSANCSFPDSSATWRLNVRNNCGKLTQIIALN